MKVRNQEVKTDRIIPNNKPDITMYLIHQQVIGIWTNYIKIISNYIKKKGAQERSFWGMRKNFDKGRKSA